MQREGLKLYTHIFFTLIISSTTTTRHLCFLISCGVAASPLREASNGECVTGMCGLSSWWCRTERLKDLKKGHTASLS